jgi:polyisoprenoid-binding protein YceI
MLLPFVLAYSLSTPAAVSGDEPAAWKIDVVHSELTFRVRHFVTKVPGTFKTWSGTIVVDPANLAGGSVEVAVETASVDTRNERRDADLRSSNFFAVDSFPSMVFKSSSVEANGSMLKITGDLSLRGTTKPVVLVGEYLGLAGPPDRQRIGFAATTTINRLDYGLKWNRLVEGSNMLGDEVEITINIEAVRQQP